MFVARVDFCFHWQQSSQNLEAEFARLNTSTDERLGRSQEQLREAERLRERTEALFQRTSQQLLLEESEATPHIIHIHKSK